MANLSANYKAMSASGNVIAYPSDLVGVFISSATGATLAIYDSATTTTGTPIVAAFTPNVTVCWYPMPFSTMNGIYAAITGTLSFTVAYN